MRAPLSLEQLKAAPRTRLENIHALRTIIESTRATKRKVAQKAAVDSMMVGGLSTSSNYVELYAHELHSEKPQIP